MAGVTQKWRGEKTGSIFVDRAPTIIEQVFDKGGVVNQAQKLAQARSVLAQAETRAGLSVSTHASTAYGWTVPECLRTCLPVLGYGALAIRGSAALMLSLAGHASKEGAWVASVGMPWLGWGAGSHYGLDLSHVAHIPQVRGRGHDVVAALIDGFDIVLVGPIGLTDRDQQSLSRRARSRAVSLLSDDWAGAPCLQAEVHPGAGYLAGIGHLNSVRIRVRYGSATAECVATPDGLHASPTLVAL